MDRVELSLNQRSGNRNFQLSNATTFSDGAYIKEPFPNSPLYINPLSNIENALNSLFPDKNEESKVSNARNILGDTAKVLGNEKLERVVADFEYLADCWLDLFERDSFEGKTLQEILRMT